MGKTETTLTEKFQDSILEKMETIETVIGNYGVHVMRLEEINLELSNKVERLEAKNRRLEDKSLPEPNDDNNSCTYCEGKIKRKNGYIMDNLNNIFCDAGCSKSYKQQMILNSPPNTDKGEV